ncbi:MAG: type II toxin-antitoxin system PemK/MazF family toxin [Candidatus Omnitrophota bacterium]
MIKRGDIILIKFPFTDLTSVKVRPALVVSSDQYNSASNDAIFMLITSKISNLFMEDLLVDANHPEFRPTGLKQPSLFKIDRIVILSKAIAARKLGEAGHQIMNEISLRLKKVLSIP